MRTALIVQPRYETPIKPAFVSTAGTRGPGVGKECWFVRGTRRRQCCSPVVRDEVKGFPTLEIPEWMFRFPRLWPDEARRVRAPLLFLRDPGETFIHFSQHIGMIFARKFETKLIRMLNHV
jgi:hypothetical protein